MNLQAAPFKQPWNPKCTSRSVLSADYLGESASQVRRAEGIAEAGASGNYPTVNTGVVGSADIFPSRVPERDDIADVCFCATTSADRRGKDNMQFSRAARQNLTLEALISWRDEYGIAHAVVGATRDVNDQGIYLYISGEGPALAAQVEITALLPAFLQRNGRTYLRGFGTVVRVEAEGFALGGKFRIETEYEPARIATPALQVSAA